MASPRGMYLRPALDALDELHEVRKRHPEARIELSVRGTCGILLQRVRP